MNCALEAKESGFLGGEKVATEDIVGLVRWMGPGSLVIPPLQSCHVQCQVDLHGLELKNESLKEITLQEGKSIGQVQPTELAALLLSTEAPETIDTNLIDFVTLPFQVSGRRGSERRYVVEDKYSHGMNGRFGLAKGVEHHIRLSDPQPFCERSRRIAPSDIEDVQRHLQDLLAAGIIKESRSPYTTSIVIAQKKNGHIRMCIDYRTLNSKTIPDQYTTPHIDDALDCLAGSHWFSVLDLWSSY
ncbi:hypothetical protein AOLI_G00035380 [Acnodon oligacanthus]